ncbi:MAG: hypothetical protein ACLGHG_01695 [Gammaproteobacteria bacterium]
MTVETTVVAHALQLFRQGRMAEALPVLESLLADGNTPLPCILALADAREATGDAAGAVRLLTALHDAMPQPDFALALAAALQRAGDRLALDATLPGLRNAHPADQRLAALHAEHLLKRGDFADGFDLLPARWSISGGTAMTHALPCPEWDGTPFPGRLLVGTEQGLGEVVLWSSMLADLVRLGQKTLVACDARLLALFRRSFPPIEFADAAGTPLQEPGKNLTNRRIESADLGRLFRRSAGDFPQAARGWLVADPARTAALRDAYRQRFPGKRLVGLSWCSHRPLRNESKDIPLADLTQLQQQDTVCVSLQYGDVAGDIALLRAHGLPVHVDPDIDITRDVDGSCALAGALDEVISCSNTMAHLAGALGRPVQLLLPGPRYVLWYWGYEGTTTPWYPSMRIRRGPGPVGSDTSP